MKKFLLSTALVGVAFAAAPAMAQVDVTVGGHTKNYIGWLSQDEGAGADERNFDMLRESELHFNAEGTADNGLTYGFHVESEVDGVNTFDVEESYLYLASSLGRLNLGSEDGAQYLLQVAAPSADANIDGIRQYIQPVNFGITGTPGAFDAAVAVDGIDYDADTTAQAEKITYLSPNWSGFQFGLSYTPDVGEGEDEGLSGFSSDDVVGALGNAYEGSLRYEGTFNNIGFALGGGYSQIDVEDEAVGDDDVQEWNVGADFDIGAFGLGAAYHELNNIAGVEDVDAQDLVVGADYTTGPFQFGLSYLDKDVENIGGAGVDVDVNRYTGGVVYTVTQGLTLRGSISYQEVDVDAAADVDSTQVLGGVQFNF